MKWEEVEVSWRRKGFAVSILRGLLIQNTVKFIIVYELISWRFAEPHAITKHQKIKSPKNHEIKDKLYTYVIK